MLTNHVFRRRLSSMWQLAARRAVTIKSKALIFHRQLVQTGESVQFLRELYQCTKLDDDELERRVRAMHERNARPFKEPWRDPNSIDKLIEEVKKIREAIA